MQLERTGSEITILGNIKSIQDSASIKNAVGAAIMEGHKKVALRIKDSFSMPSAVIGYLMKVVHHDQVQLVVEVGDERLLTLLESLNLETIFGARLHQA
ncbi:hypothetical protein [Geomesophilobacter sediminis]|uniref:STAS domain-containing protein n=1 Tax=Geomesophilobacter sediminis TaxID=2798584 RepID=A0A8J7IL04_9BACT|nr:hypothetical protein [Geomesophilobacter sediminis]MBJ6723378.1 hypothetical protein [Geomesophilobacter sediminis]